MYSIGGNLKDGRLFYLTGRQCELDVDECSGVWRVCRNGGQCENTWGSFICHCQHGFTGSHCQLNPDNCSPSKTSFPSFHHSSFFVLTSTYYYIEKLCYNICSQVTTPVLQTNPTYN